MLKIDYRIVFILITILLSSCASTTVVSHKIGDASSLCSKTEKKSALVLWGAAWRKDQKEPPIREDIAEKGINRFFSTESCFSSFKIMKTIDSKSVLTLSDVEILNYTQKLETKYDKVIILRVEELGPIVNLNLGLVLLDGSTDVKIRARVLDTKTGKLDYDNETQWDNGGPYILKGLKTLEQDLYDTLKSVFYN